MDSSTFIAKAVGMENGCFQTSLPLKCLNSGWVAL